MEESCSTGLPLPLFWDEHTAALAALVINEQRLESQRRGGSEPQGDPPRAAIAAEPAGRETDRLFEKIPFGPNTDAEPSYKRSRCTECNFISVAG